MTCYICSKETDYKSVAYAEIVCANCEMLFRESDRKRRLFMEEYRTQHECCPICGHELHTTTLSGYVYVSGHEDEFKDLNECECTNCKDKHTYHDRIPKN